MGGSFTGAFADKKGVFEDAQGVPAFSTRSAASAHETCRPGSCGFFKST